jgi:sulfoxide reductase catalytic subunit YedY
LRSLSAAGAADVGAATSVGGHLQYLSLTLPVDQSWTRYNSLQQLAYFVTVFVAAPMSILTGSMQGPAISNRLGWFGKALNRQRARSLHFLAMWWFLLFILVHVTLVFITGARVNLNMMCRRHRTLARSP